MVRFEAKVSSDRDAVGKSAAACNTTHHMTLSGGADPTRESRAIRIVQALQNPPHEDQQRQKKKILQPTKVLDGLATDKHQPQKKLDTLLKAHNATTKETAEGNVCDDREVNSQLRQAASCHKGQMPQQKTTGQTKAQKTQHPFGRGHQSAQLMAHTPLRIVQHRLLSTAEPTNFPSLVTNALATSTRSEHRRFLAELVKYPSYLQKIPLDEALVIQVEAMRKERLWTWATTHKKLVTALHVLAILPVYRAGTQPIQLKLSTVVTQAMKTAGREKAMERARAQPISNKVWDRSLLLAFLGGLCV